MGASPHAGCHCPGTRADAFRVVFARNPVAHTPRKHVEGALKHAKITAKTLRQVMRRKLRSTGRKSATNYLSGTTLILTINTSRGRYIRFERFRLVISQYRYEGMVLWRMLILGKQIRDRLFHQGGDRRFVPGGQDT